MRQADPDGSTAADLKIFGATEATNELFLLEPGLPEGKAECEAYALSIFWCIGIAGCWIKLLIVYV